MQSLKSSSEEHAIYDPHYERIGKVDDVRVGKPYRVTHVGFKMGLIGNTESKDDQARPHFGQDETVSPELEDRVRTFFGMDSLHSSVAWRGSYAADARATLRRHAV